MEFACSICGYRSDRKYCVSKHVKKQTKCGEGVPEILEIPIEIKCDHCNKEFNTIPSMKRHLKTCKIKKTNIEEELIKVKKELEEAKKVNKKLVEQTDHIQSNITNIQTQNNTINITIQLRPYNDPKLEDDMDDVYEDAWSKKKSIPAFIERLHLNNDLPENHNMCITNLRTKLAKVFTEQGWMTKDQDAFLDEIINNTNRLMDKWVRAKKSRKEYENDYMEYLDSVGKKKFDKETKKELKLMLYDAYKNGTVDIKSGTKQYVPIMDDE